MITLVKITIMSHAITNDGLLLADPALGQRAYQLKALRSIFKYDKCLVKMFCGTGKSRIITNTIIHSNKDLSVAVFPSLALIQQYSSDYVATMLTSSYRTINVSSLDKDVSTTDPPTTDPSTIQSFLLKKGKKIVLVTYQSYEVLLKALDGQKIGLVCYDEAHHVVSPETQKLVFETPYFEKEVFFTATPRNENGITMYDREAPEKNMCGELAYNYTYLQGLNDDFLNGFDVCVDMYTENTNASIYEGMSRAIIARGTGRVLTFHADVNNSESNTSVWKFVDLEKFKVSFSKVLTTEFPDRASTITKITFEGMDGKTPHAERKKLLQQLDDTSNEDIFILSSCETLGEGVDTKRANMCVFADPKTSITKIIQNIGRVVRKDVETPVSTIFIPCYVNLEHYSSANGDPEKQDELIREQMRTTNGDYAPVLNVLAALKQEDEELYEQCLNYPAKTHKERSLNEQGFTIDEEYDDITYTEDDVQRLKDAGDPLEIHTNDTIERFNEDNEEEPMTRLYYDVEEDTYKPIVRLSTDDDSTDEEDDNRQVIEPPKKQKHISLSIHQNSDILMLWSVKGELDFSKKFCSVTIDCTVSWNEEKWFKKLYASKAYIEMNNKAPSQYSNDPELSRLGSWFTLQKQYFKKQRMTVTKKIAWESCMKDPIYGVHYVLKDDNWFENLEKVTKIIDAENKVPSSHSTDSYTNKLGQWFTAQKQYYKNKTNFMNEPEKKTAWEACMTDPNYVGHFVVKEIKDNWFMNLKDSKAYIETNDKAPSYGSKDTKTKRLGGWLQKQKESQQKLSGLMKDHKKKAAWEAFATDPKYAPYLRSFEEDWYTTLNAVKQYIDVNGKSPSANSEDLETKRIGHWISTQKTNYRDNCHNMKKKEIIAAWEAFISDPKYAPYFTTGKEDWYNNLTAVKKYIDANNKSPSSQSKDPETKRIGSWISVQKKNINIMQNPEIHAEWEAFINDPTYAPYFTTREENWYTNLTKAKQYIDNNGNSPSPRAEDPETRRLAQWIYDRKRNYTKNAEGMKNPEIRSAWEAFITDPKYAPYIKQSPQSTPDTSEAETPMAPQTTKLTVRVKLVKPMTEPEQVSTQSVSLLAEKPKIKILAKPKLKTVEAPAPTPKPKSFSDLTEEERQAICERHLKKQTETKGYRSTNPNDKDTINMVFSQHINLSGDGKVVFLDHTEFKTAYALLERGVRPEQMLIPQWPDNYAIMSQHELFGSSVILGDFNVELKKYLDSPDAQLKAVYADYCGTLQKDGVPFVELLSAYKAKLMPDAVIGVTLTLRNPEGVRFSGQDISMMEKKLTRAFPAHQNLFHKAGIIEEDDGPYTYGGGAPMATWLITIT